MLEVRLCMITEQEEKPTENRSRTAAIPPTIRKPFLCRAMNAPVFFVASSALFAALAVVSEAFAVLLAPFPALAAAYSFLIARFCCHLEYGFTVEPFCSAYSLFNARTLALSAAVSALSAFLYGFSCWERCAVWTIREPPSAVPSAVSAASVPE